MEYLSDTKPRIEDFINGRFFGNFCGDEYPTLITVEKNMIDCLEADDNPDIEKVGSLELIDSIPYRSYGYVQDLAEILNHYEADYQRRANNTINFEKASHVNFIGDRLIEMKKIINEHKLPPT
jgi:hypothetical protein